MNVVERRVEITAGDVALEGDISVPDDPRGVVLFAHGSGSSRHSPRNRAVASELQQAGLATVLVDLLTAREEQIDDATGQLRFDIDLLSSRLIAIVDWLVDTEPVARLGVGLFGASTGAGGALVAAAARPEAVAAVVSRGGRPDLAGRFLPLVRQPTLLIVGELDTIVIELNRRAMEQLGGAARLVIVPGATHLFEETGALAEVARLAREWFLQHVAPRNGGRDPSDVRRSAS
jgi:putative phosphoribosyl transferase